MWKRQAFKLQRGDSWYHSPIDRPATAVTSKNCDISNSKIVNETLPEHPFVVCLIDGVEVNALVDTGSMKSFINDKLHSLIDLEGSRLIKSTSQRCTSITGGNLNILGHIFTSVHFPNTSRKLNSSFLVSNNIPYDCVLGWDFLTQHRLSIHGDFGEGRSSYQLVGTYGKTPIHANHSAMRAQSNGVVITEEQPPIFSPTDSSINSAILVQSQLKGVNKVILSEGISIPARTEIIIKGKVQAKDISQVGMISACQSDSVKHLKGLQVAYLVVTPVDKCVPVRLINTTTEDVPPNRLKFG